MKIEYARPEDLRPAKHNPRTCSPKALKALARLLDEHGFVDPVVARRADKLLIAGHQRLKANTLRRKPDRRVPVVFLSDISDDRAKALNIALNNPEAQGRYDSEKLAELLGELDSGRLDLPAVTGFDAERLAELARAEDLPAIEPVDLPGEPAASDNVVVIFEMTRKTFRSLKDRFDELIAAAGVTCRVRFDGEAEDDDDADETVM